MSALSPRLAGWLAPVALTSAALAMVACQATEHAPAGDATGTGGEELAAAGHASDDDEDLEFEVDDPGGTPVEVVDSERLLMTKLEDRRDDLDERELALARRSKELDDLDAEIDTRLGNISRLEKRLQEQLGIGKVAHQRRDERIAALSELVATMTPQAGADLVAQLGDADAQWILMSIARKNQRKAAKLMAAMPSDRAAQLGQLYLDSDPKSVPGGDSLGPLDAGGASSDVAPASPAAGAAASAAAAPPAAPEDAGEPSAAPPPASAAGDAPEEASAP